MTASRTKLSLRPSPQVSDEDKAALLTEAMTRRVRVRWSYNRTLMQVAPQLLYMRNDSLHCDAVVIERGGVAPRELKLGAFKLAGLKDMALTADAFEPMADIDTSDPRYAAGIVARA